MKKREIEKKLLYVALTAMLASTGMSVTSFAAAPADYMKENIQAGDIWDLSEDGSLTIHKYDMTTAEKNGVSVEALIEATGQQDASVESNMKDYAIEGVEFTYLYCGQAETHRTLKNDMTEIEMVYEVPGELKNLLGLSDSDAINMRQNGTENCQNSGVYHYSSTQINQALKSVLNGGSNGSKLAKEALEDYVIKHQNAVHMPLTDEKGVTSKDHMNLGLYLVVESKVPENVTESVNPWFVSLPFTDVTGDEWLYDVQCYPKNQTGNPTLDKYVRNSTENQMDVSLHRAQETYEETATASEGDVMDYIFVSKLPHINGTSTYLTEYTFLDTLCEGLDYNRDAKIAFYTSEEAARQNALSEAVEIWDYQAETGNLYGQEYAMKKDSSGRETTDRQMKITFTKDGLKKLNTEKSDYWMVVYYTATVHSDASAVLGDLGNENDVSLTWRRTSEDYYDTLEDECFVYTYGIDVMKKFSDDQGDPTKVKFQLFNQDDGQYVMAKLQEDEKGQQVYYVTGYTDSKDQATIMSPDKDGHLLIQGVEADTYQFTEIGTDTGYTLLKQPVEIAITETTMDENGVHGATALVDKIQASMSDYMTKKNQQSENGKVVLTVTNNKSFLLPKTGGTGTFMVTIAGILIAGAGCATMMRKSKERKTNIS